MTLADCNAWVARLCLDGELDLADPKSAEGVAPALAEHWLKLPVQRQNVYRHLVFCNLREIVVYVFRDTARCVGDEIFHAWLRRFLSARAVRSQHYYNVPFEFWEFAEDVGLFKDSGIAALVDLADYEITRWQLYQRPNQSVDVVTRQEVALLDARPIFNPDLVLKTYTWRVDEWQSSGDPQKIEPCFLLLYRSVETRLVETQVLNSAAFSFLQTCLKNPHKTLSELLDLFAASAQNLPEEWAEEILPFLQELLRRGIVLAVV